MEVDRTARLVRWVPAAVLILTPCLLVGWALRSGGMLDGLDMLTGNAFIRGFVGQELASGRAAAWDPNAMCGFPLLAALQASVFYPLTWLILFVDPETFWNLTVLIHLILAGAFAYGWLRHGLSIHPAGALVGALISMLSGYLVTHVYAGHIGQISSYPWLAALLWRTERLLVRPTLRRGVLLAASMTLLILPGFPQSASFGILLLIVRLVLHVFGAKDGRKGRLRVAAAAAAAVGLGVVLAAPQFLPTLELVPRTHRVSMNTYTFATSFSMPSENLLTLLAPTFFGGGPQEPYWGRSAIWESCGFVGVGGLAFAALAWGGRHPQRRMWAAVAVAALLLALGSSTVFFKAFYYAVPGANLFRAPGRYLALFTMAMAALAAMGFERWWKDEEGVRRATFRVGLGAAALFLMLLASIPVFDLIWVDLLDGVEAGPDSYFLHGLRQEHSGFADDSFEKARRSLGWAAVSLVIVGIVLISHSRAALRASSAAAVVGVVLVLELVGFGSRYVVAAPIRSLAWPPDFVESVKRPRDGPYRIATLGNRHHRHVGKCQLAGIANVGGYETMLLRTYAELLNVVCGYPPGQAAVTVPLSGPHPVLDMLGVRTWLLPSGTSPSPAWKRVGWVEDCEVFESSSAFPRAYLVPAAVARPEREDRLAYLTSPSTDLRKVVVLETPPSAEEVARPGNLGSARVMSFSPGRYEIAAETPSGAWLVLTEADYPGWEARVDGAPTEIRRANHLVQAIWLPPGTHAVRFDYRSRWLGTGFLLLALGAAVPALLALRARLARR